LTETTICSTVHRLGAEDFESSQPIPTVSAFAKLIQRNEEGGEGEPAFEDPAQPWRHAPLPRTSRLVPGSGDKML
jgi:hypothetical protein